MDTQNTSRQLRYLEEVRIPLHRAGFGTLPLEGEQLPVLWNGTPLCRITGKGSVFYRREDADTPQAEDALYRVEDIAAKTLEYMAAMETAPQLKASGLDGDYRILADFGGTMLAGTPSKYGVQFVTWDWDYDRTGVVHGHYFMENYDEARRSLDAVGWQVDYIITHCAPTSIALMGSRHNEADRLTDFLQEVWERAKYHYWLFGHYHDNKAIDEKHILLWEQIVRVI